MSFPQCKTYHLWKIYLWLSTGIASNICDNSGSLEYPATGPTRSSIHNEHGWPACARYTVREHKSSRVHAERKGEDSINRRESKAGIASQRRQWARDSREWRGRWIVNDGERWWLYLVTTRDQYSKSVIQEKNQSACVAWNTVFFEDAANRKSELWDIQQRMEVVG